ncbi:MAG TPA: electron transport complex subunit E [Sedimentibacter sp.]|jgi:electron transport complex protein RnfE|nr:electron transport complex subunit E [Sedimentibacter sp.]NLA14399.1 electron transport complex subunit E [Tissierellia bacterium]HAS92113.1 electron transport complex subunit RsxE [Clostridiales bacterium]HOA19379.1 electron transport complex subunit E [Sedimentibacter sp.]HOG62091.1 electron transport complex subunit E [Sedimentibacter sp.]
MNKLEIFKNGVTTENPILVQQVGMCATLAITTSLINGIGMGVAVIAVLTGSNIVISLLRKFIPDEVRIPSFIIVIAAFTTIIDLLMHAYTFELYKALGVFIPLIVVNCIILARAEAFASKNSLSDSIIDGLGMGLGYLVAMILLSSVREILGNGTILGFRILPEAYEPMMMAIQPPGAFILLGLLIGIVNYLSRRKKA